MLSFHEQAWEDYLYWQQTDKQVLRKLNNLIRDALRHPMEGLGKPEPLKLNLAGYWSRRITGEHRLVYTMEGSELIIVQCRGHYD